MLTRRAAQNKKGKMLSSVKNQQAGGNIAKSAALADCEKTSKKVAAKADKKTTQKNIEQYVHVTKVTVDQGETTVISEKELEILEKETAISQQETVAGAGLAVQSDIDNNAAAMKVQAIYDRLIEFEKTQHDILEKLESLVTMTYIEEKFKEVVNKHQLQAELNSLKETIKNEIYERVNEDIEKIRSEVHDVDVLVQVCKKNIQSLNGRADKQDENHITSRLNFMRVQKRCEELENYSRRNSVRIFGIPDKDTETVEDCAEKVIKLLQTNLELKVDIEHIDIAHRMGTYQKGRSRTIIVKFVSKRVKNMVIFNRRKLKGSQVVIIEDVSKDTQELMKEALKKDETEKSWTKDGTIYALLKNKNIVKIHNYSDIEKISSLKPVRQAKPPK